MDEKINELVDEQVQEENWKDRLMTEYYFVKEKQLMLGTVLEAVISGQMDFNFNCPIEVLLAQYHAMSSYLACLELRAGLAGIATEQEQEEEQEDVAPEMTD